MRPIRLELENFTVYRGRHSLDFSPLSFFVIKGRTGAGKTSLIDAICYALYGKVPRYLGEKAHAHLISRGQKHMRVSLEFSVRGRIYRIDREYETGKKKGQSDFRFYEGGRARPFREEELRKHLRDILRIDYNTFTKVILLPQNQFDRFLKPQEQKERREILNSLLGFSGLFSLLKELVGEEYRSLMGKHQLLQSRLEQLSEANGEGLLQKERQLRGLEEEYGRLLEERSGAEQTLNLCRERDRLEREYEQAQGQLQVLLEQEETINAKRQVLEIALDILPYLPEIEHYERLSKEEERLLAERQKKELELRGVMEHRQTVEEAFRRLQREFESLEEVSRRRDQLRDLLQLLQQYMSTRSEVKAVEKEMESVGRELSERRAEEEELRKRFATGLELTSQVSQSIKALEEEGIEEQIKRAQELRSKVEKLRELQRKEKELEREHALSERELEKKRKELTEKLSLQRELGKKAESLQSELEELRSGLSDEGELLQEELMLRDLQTKLSELGRLRKERMALQKRLSELYELAGSVEEDIERLRGKRLEAYALEIRAGLREGDTCPVCGGRVLHPVHQKAQEDLQVLTGRLRELEGRRDALRKELSELEANLSFLERREEELLSLSGGITQEELSQRLARVQESLEELRQRKRLLQEKEKELLDFRKREGELSRQVEALRAQESELREKVSASSALLESVREEGQAIAHLLGEDVDAVLEEIERVEHQYEELRSLRDKERKYRQRLEDLQGELLQVEKRITELEEKKRGLSSQKSALEEKLSQMGETVFRSLGEKPSELLSIRLRKEVDHLEKRIKEVQGEYQKTAEYLQKVRSQEVGLLSDIQNIERFISSVRSQKAELSSDIYELEKRFGSFEKAREHALTQEQIRVLQKEVEDYHMNRHSLQKRLESLKERLSTLSGLPDTRTAEEALRSLDSELSQNRERYGSLQGEIESLRKALIEKEELEKGLAQLRTQISLYERLRNDLVDNQFPEFVSQLMLKRITDRASHYLFKFTSGQFAFELLEGDLNVLDHATGHHRVVSSLSGGETFLASLSLAFAVADILSQNAPLESLFIDEGFGSLDRETRESLSEFFDLIRQSTDRMVGIITHVEDIAEKFSQRIEVEKSGGSARLKVIY